MSTVNALRALCTRLITSFRLASAATWLRSLVIFIGVAVAVTSCKMMH
jgi:hypothetical protein